MPKINMLPLGMSGVDMLSNPHLLPAKKKLRSAVNLRFEEGALRTRPGFRYSILTGPGQFQGACEFRPQRGISSGTFSDLSEGVAVVVDGVLWFRCRERSGELFCGKGSVHVFQAENYLVMQNPNTSTYWWDGAALTESPGMQEVDFNDPEVPWVEVSNEVLVGEETDCSEQGGGGGGGGCSTDLIFHIYDKNTLEELQANLRVKINAGTLFDDLVEANGTKLFRDTLTKEHAYKASKEGYSDFEGVFTPTECVPNHVDVFLEPSSEVDSCLLATSDIVFGESPEAGWVKVTNIGGSPVTVQNVLSSVDLVSTDPAVPFEVPVEGFVLLLVTAEEALAGTALTLVTECGTDTEITWPIEECTNDDLTIVPAPVGGDLTNEANFTVTNNSSVDAEITSVDSVPFPGELAVDPAPPQTISPGDSLEFHCIASFGDIRGTAFIISTSCGEPIAGAFASE